ncbi:MAG: quinate 5-dehydrogenase [Anaerolineae bacterium]
MKRAVSISLGSADRDKSVVIILNGQPISLERIGAGGDVEKARRLFAQLDGRVDALSIGGVDLTLPLGRREYPLRAALKLVQDVRRTPVVDGGGLKNTLERRVFELAAPALGGIPHFKSALVPVGIDRPGLAVAVAQVADRVVYGDLMFGLGLPIPLRGLRQYYAAARLLLPIVSYFPIKMLYYDSKGEQPAPRFVRHWNRAELVAGDYMFMQKYIPHDLGGKTIVTNTTTAQNIELLRARGARRVITTTPRYEGRSFGTNMMEAALTAYAGKGRPLTDAELNALIDELRLKPSVQQLND